MLYDLGVRPAPKSRLESVFMIISNRRQLQEFYKTRVLVEAALAPHLKDSGKALQDATRKYAASLMPYLAKMTTSVEKKHRRELESWVKHGPLVIRPLWMLKGGSLKRARSALAARGDAVRANSQRRPKR